MAGVQARKMAGDASKEDGGRYKQGRWLLGCMLSYVNLLNLVAEYAFWYTEIQPGTYMYRTSTSLRNKPRFKNVLRFGQSSFFRLRGALSQTWASKLVPN